MVTVGFVSEIYNVTENETSVVVCTKLFEGITDREFSVSAVVITDSTASKSLKIKGCVMQLLASVRLVKK